MDPKPNLMQWPKYNVDSCTIGFEDKLLVVKLFFFLSSEFSAGVTTQSIPSDQIIPQWQTYAQVHLMKFLDASIGKTPHILLLRSLNISN